MNFMTSFFQNKSTRTPLQQVSNSPCDKHNRENHKNKQSLIPHDVVKTQSDCILVVASPTKP